MKIKVAVACLMSLQFLSPLVIYGETFNEIWDRANAPHQIGDYVKSEQLYAELLSQYPASQRAALRIAIAQEKQGKLQEALVSYDQVCAIDPDGDWAAFALFYKARACAENELEVEALAACSLLEKLHPDSPFAARVAEVRASMNHENLSVAKSAVAKDLTVAESIQDALDISAKGKDAEAIEVLMRIANNNSFSNVRYRAIEAAGNIHFRNSEYIKAQQCFALILAGLGNSHPESRIVRNAHTRTAGLYHVLEDRLSALNHFRAAVGEKDDKTSEHALLQIAGLLFEIKQRDVWSENPVEVSDWAEYQAFLTDLLHSNTLSNMTRARLKLMRLEAYNWQNTDYQLISDAAHDFLTDFRESIEMRQEVGTALMVWANAAKRFSHFDDAILAGKETLALFPVESEIWPGMDHISRTYFDLIESLYFRGQIDNGHAYFEELKQRFPNSDYIEAIEANFRAGVYQNESEI